MMDDSINLLFRKIKEHLIVNKNTTFEELLTLRQTRRKIKKL